MVELVAKRYGTALFEIAVENNEIDLMANEVLELKKILSEEIAFIDLLKNPKVSEKEREEMINTVFSGKISNSLLGLIQLVIKKGRQDRLLDIFEYFLKRIDGYRGIVVADVMVHKPLTSAQRDQLVVKLEAITNKKINLREIVDESLIGGIKIRIGDRIADYSIKGLMADLSKQLFANS